ncbi:ChbG/HpnK family deacetylase [Clostridium sp. BL-8]|uniref:ChbG/HpnK family deacetylase n=1 Tax=Clostridium sp. BL-8 TaxID=349938 RepID=UPI00098C5741|nr:ChbG/HpnK family deacetylase [Clostridium sp. BL-8]OOM80882.1 hypothetical protein CLOBL_04810 [Clostridium sp. BL-8]
MKLIIRADDLGLTDGVNHGICKAIEDGIVTSVGLMANMPDAQAGYNLVKKFKHVSIGQHSNASIGKPCSDPQEIPSMVDEHGNFISSKKHRNAFNNGMDLINFEDAVREVEAQLDKFRKITGGNPAYFDRHAIESKNLDKAIEYVANKNDVVYIPFMKSFSAKDIYCKFAKLPIMSEENLYDPFSYFLNDEGEILENNLSMIAVHPGYVDQNLLELSSYNMIRPLEVKVLTSIEIKDWIKRNNIELINCTVFNK